MNESVIIRSERPDDARAVENLVREAFWNVYRPGCLEHYALHRLRTHPAFIRPLDLVAAAWGVGAVCFKGNIAFYGKSGFVAAASKDVRYQGLPKGADASFFLCKELKAGYLDGVRGEYAPPSAYFVCQQEPAAFDAYEAQFPAKEKLRLPGQIFEN